MRRHLSPRDPPRPDRHAPGHAPPDSGHRPGPGFRLSCLLLCALAAAGCYRRVSYTSPEGRTVEIVNFGFDTRIGSLHAQTDSGTLRIENAESQALLSQRLAELAAALADGGK